MTRRTPVEAREPVDEAEREDGAKEVRRYLFRLALLILAGLVVMTTAAVLAWFHYGAPLERREPPGPPSQSAAP